MSGDAAGGERQQRVRLGKVVAHFGLAGWLKIESYTEPRERIFEYRPLYFGAAPIDEFEGKTHGRGLLIRIPGRDRREAVEELLGCALTVDREQLPDPEPGEYYWSDLTGCRVVNGAGHEFGTVKRMMATGANDVLVVGDGSETLIPFVQGRYVSEVDIEGRRIVVDWEPDY